MPFIPSPHAALANMVFFDGVDRAWVNGFWFTKTDYTVEDMGNLGQALEDAFTASDYKTDMPDEMGLSVTNVYDMRTDGGGWVQVIGGVNGAGQGNALSLGLACVVTLRTAKRGRSYRGRVYLSGWTEEGISLGVFSGGVTTKAKAFVDAIISGAAAEGWTLCIRSTRHNGVELETAVLTPVTSTIVRSSKPGTMRRRIDRP